MCEENDNRDSAEMNARVYEKHFIFVSYSVVCYQWPFLKYSIIIGARQ